MSNTNNRETGARTFPARVDADASDEVSQAAAENKKPAKGMGLSESLDDVNDKTRHSDGVNPPLPRLRRDGKSTPRTKPN
jgi:hypothetical protein